MRGRLVVALLAAAMVAGMTWVAAPPASANQSVSVDCLTSSDSDLILVPGETLSFSLTNCNGMYLDSNVLVAPMSSVYYCGFGLSNPIFSSFYVTQIVCTPGGAGLGVYSVNVTVAGSVALGNAIWFTTQGGTRTVYVRSSSAPGPADSASAQVEDVLQQVEADSGDCGALRRPDLSWNGVSADGWSRSWAQWANGGLGGAVCTRTLGLVGGTWSVR